MRLDELQTGQARGRSHTHVDFPALAASVFTCGEVSKSIAAMSAELDVGSVAPDFRLSANDGRELRLVDFRDKALVVLFFVREYN